MKTIKAAKTFWQALLFSCAFLIGLAAAPSSEAAPPDYCSYAKDGDRGKGKWAGLLRLVSDSSGGGSDDQGKSGASESSSSGSQ